MSIPQERPPVARRIAPRRLLGAVALAASVALWLVSVGNTGDSSTIAPELILDANRAPIEVLLTLPGIGPARAAAIEEARRSRPFASLDDLDRRVKGIGPATAAQLRPFLRFDAMAPNP